MGLLDFLSQNNQPLGAGPNPQAQQNAMIGASMMEKGLNQADVMLANIQPTAEGRAGIIQAGQKSNADVAQAMRTRYFQKEMEQIRQLQLQPLLQELQEAQAVLKQRVAVAARPVLRTVSPEEGQFIVGSLAEQQSMQTGAPVGPPGAAGATAPSADGKPGQPLPTTPIQPNPALAPGQAGGVLSQDELSITDPATGEPVGLMTDRGFQVYQEAINDFYGVNTRVQMGMMDVLASYPTNPFAQTTMKAMMDNVSQQAGQAVTGKTDPMEMQKWMDERNKMETEIEAARAETAVNLFNVKAGEGKLYGQAGAARTSLLEDPRGTTSYFTPEDQERVASGQELDPQTTARAAGVAGALAQRDELDMKRDQERARQGLLFVPQRLVPQPERWMQWLQRSDPTFQASMKRSFALAANKAQNELIALTKTPEGQALLTEKLQSVGATQYEIERALQPGGLADEAMEAVVARVAGVSGYYKGARASAFAETLQLAEGAQPELTPIIDRELTAYVEERLKPDYRREHGHEMPPSAVARVYQDRYRMFAAAYADAMPQDDPQPVDAQRIRTLDSLVDADERARAQDQLEADRDRVDAMDAALSRLSDDDYEAATGVRPTQTREQGDANAAEADEALRVHKSETKPYEPGKPLDLGFSNPGKENRPAPQEVAPEDQATPSPLGVAQPGPAQSPFAQQLSSLRPSQMSQEQIGTAIDRLSGFRDANRGVLAPQELEAIGVTIANLSAWRTQNAVGGAARAVGGALYDAFTNSPEEIAAQKALRRAAGLE